VLGRSILKIGILTPSVIAGPPETFRKQVEARCIVGVERKGKALALHLHGNSTIPPAYLLVRLGMTGQIVVAPRAAPLLPHTHVRMALDEGADELRYCDSRRFGRLRCCSRKELSNIFGSLGADALQITEEQFRQSLYGRRGAIKGLLMNQAIISGLGNIYADEALFKAQIHPETPAGEITNSAARKLLNAIKTVLRRAVDLQGTSFRDYIDIEGRPGNFRARLCVYQRTGKPCLRCGTSIRRILVCGRSSHFCPRCQRRLRVFVPRGVAARGRGRSH
jgi:formamidopyrimidine-DNA glycosylase